MVLGRSLAGRGGLAAFLVSSGPMLTIIAQVATRVAQLRTQERLVSLFISNQPTTPTQMSIDPYCIGVKWFQLFSRRF
jgi:hypothetical protein